MKFQIKKTNLIGGGHVFDANILPNTRFGVPAKVIFSFNEEQEALDFLDDLKAVISKHLPFECFETTMEGLAHYRAKVTFDDSTPPRDEIVTLKATTYGDAKAEIDGMLEDDPRVAGVELV